MVSFDVSSDVGPAWDDGGTQGGPAGPGQDDGWFVRRVGRPVERRWGRVPRRVRRFAVTATAAVLVLGTGAAVAVDVRLDRAHAERLVAAPGGVVDLSIPVERTWEVASDGGVLATMPGGRVVTTAGPDLLAVDATSGAELWRHDLGVPLDCGPRQMTAAELTRPVDRVVCLSGSPSRTVTVVGASGEVLGRRDIGPAGPGGDGWIDVEGDGRVRGAVPAAGGAIAVLDRSVLSLDSAMGAGEAFAELEARRAEGTWQDPVLRIEDALTGEVRAEETIEVRREDLRDCGFGTRSGEPGGHVSLTASLWTEAVGISFSFCARSVWIAADGTVQDGGRSWVTADGDRLESTDEGTRIVAGDGSRQDDVLLPGFVLETHATDGTGGPLVVRDLDGALAAFSRSGERLWTRDVTAWTVLARAGETVVVADEARSLEGIDMNTGEELWSRDDLLEGVDPHAMAGLGGSAVTDGSVVVVVVPGGSGLVALDLADGSTRWRAEGVGFAGSIVAVDGHLLAFDTGEISDGGPGATIKGALLGLG